MAINKTPFLRSHGSPPTESGPKLVGQELAHHHAEFGGRIVALSGAGGVDNLMNSAEMLSPLLSGLEAGERLGIEFVIAAAGDVPRIGMRGLAAAPSAAEAEIRREKLSAMLTILLSGQMPGFYCRPHEARDAVPAVLSHEIALHPRGRPTGPDRRQSGDLGPRAVATVPAGVLLPTLGFSPERVTAAIALMRALGRPIAMRLDLALVAFDAATLRQIGTARDAAQTGEPRSTVEAMRHLAETVSDDALLTALLNDGGGVRLTVSVRTAHALDAADQRMLCHALFGTQQADSSIPAGLDLSRTFPRGYALPRAVAGLAAAAALSLSRSPALYTRPPAGAFVLGHTPDGRTVALSDADRAMHMALFGGTGTGKSTLMLNQLAEDMAAGKGCLLLDPHGDLWEAARGLVPAHRRKDLILAHLGDPRHGFTMNVLSGLGGDPGVERNATVNGLLRLFTNSLWPGVPEAFGPMFELYFRNALLLQMAAEREGATILGVERIFQDENYRRELLKRADDSHVVDFWRKTAERVTNHEIDIDNIAPYIIAKFAPFTTSPLLRPILASTTSSLDLKAAIDSGKIVLINLAKGIVGEGASRLVGALLTMRLVASAQTQMRRPEAERRPFVAVLDEFQTYATEHIAEAIEETRKYKLSLTLACQSLGQIDGRHKRADVGRAIVANVANLVAFRLGVEDAAILQRYFEPGFRPEDMMFLPNHTAVARLLTGGQAMRPLEFRTRRPPTPTDSTP